MYNLRRSNLSKHYLCVAVERPALLFPSFPTTGILDGGTLITFIGQQLAQPPPIRAHFIPSNSLALPILYGVPVLSQW